MIVGCGDVGLRVASLLAHRYRLLALTSSPQRADALRRAGITPLVGNLDQPSTLQRLGGLSDALLHLAPPQAQGVHDARTLRLLHALARRGRARRLVYASTTGVYGNGGGDRFDETRAVRPQTERASRRVDAEQHMRRYGRAMRACVTILRVPGIYARDRAGHPRERLARGAPVLVDADDVYTNHIHADDLARACVAALARGLPQRVVHVCDDSELKMGEYFDLAADLLGVPRPPRVSRAQASKLLSPMQMSFLGESRRLVNHRMKRELRLRLRYPTVREGLVERA